MADSGKDQRPKNVSQKLVTGGTQLFKPSPSSVQRSPTRPSGGPPSDTKDRDWPSLPAAASSQPGGTGDDLMTTEDMQTEPPPPAMSGNDGAILKDDLTTPVFSRERGKRGRHELDPDTPSPEKPWNELTMRGIGDVSVSLITWFHTEGLTEACSAQKP